MCASTAPTSTATANRRTPIAMPASTSSSVISRSMIATSGPRQRMRSPSAETNGLSRARLRPLIAPPSRKRRLGRPGAAANRRTAPAATAVSTRGWSVLKASATAAAPSSASGPGARLTGPTGRRPPGGGLRRRRRPRSAAAARPGCAATVRAAAWAAASSRPATATSTPSSGCVAVGTAATSARAPGTGARPWPSGPSAVTRPSSIATVSPAASGSARARRQAGSRRARASLAPDPRPPGRVAGDPRAVGRERRAQRRVGRHRRAVRRARAGRATGPPRRA